MVFVLNTLFCCLWDEYIFPASCYCCLHNPSPLPPSLTLVHPSLVPYCCLHHPSVPLFLTLIHPSFISYFCLHHPSPLPPPPTPPISYSCSPLIDTILLSAPPVSTPPISYSCSPLIDTILLSAPPVSTPPSRTLVHPSLILYCCCATRLHSIYPRSHSCSPLLSNFFSHSLFVAFSCCIPCFLLLSSTLEDIGSRHYPFPSRSLLA